MTESQHPQDARAIVAELNFNVLLRLARDHGLRFGTSMKDWRPTVRSRGTVPGVAQGLTLLATDGIAAYFLRDDGSVLYGHVGHFDGRVAPLFSASTSGFSEGKTKRKGAPRAKSEKARERERRRKLLDDL